MKMFTEDLARTYGRIESRTKEMAQEAESGDVEQIQLVAQDPGVEISFRLPDGPPPAELRVEGEGADQIDIEGVSLVSLLYHIGHHSTREPEWHFKADHVLFLAAPRIPATTMGNL